MTIEQQNEIKGIINIVSDEYNISLCSPLKVVNEAVAVTAFLLSKNTDLTNKAIAITLGRSMRGEFVSIVNKNIRAKLRADDDFKKKLINLEVKILSSKL